jgi:hypothetical protein
LKLISAVENERGGFKVFKKLSRLSLMLLGLSLSVSAHAQIQAQKFSVKTGSSGGGLAQLTAVDGSVMDLYSNGVGALEVVYTFNVTGHSQNLKLSAAYSESTSSDIFLLQAKNTSGVFVTIGQASGAGKQTLSLPIASDQIVGGIVTVRIYAAKNHDDFKLDYLTIVDQGGAPTPTPVPTPVSTPMPTPGPTPVPTPMPPVGGVRLPPSGNVSWDWQIGATSESAIRTPTGAVMMDLDGFTTSAAEVAKLKAQGVYTVCYIDAGSWEPGRPDSAAYPSYLKIYFDSQWNEWFLDVTDVFQPNSVLAQLLKARLQMCKDKGFDALEPDNLQNDENAGGKITLKQQLDFNGWIADAAHSVGLAVLQKNGPDKVLMTTTSGQKMVDKFDGILNEECAAFSECGGLQEYVKRGKIAVDVEYKASHLNCAVASQYGFNMMLKDLSLVGAGDKGYIRQTCP